MLSRTLIISIVVVVILGMLALMLPGPTVEPESSTATPSPTFSTAPATVAPSAAAASVSWLFNGTAWAPSSAAPTCPSPLGLQSPVDVSKATAILYPGQSRGGNYKAHGGFRFDTSPTNDVPVSLALDATLLRGSRYIESGVVQIMLDFVHPCGYLLRYDHLLTLSPEFQALVDATLPEAKPNASETKRFPATKEFSKGTVIATAIGFPAPNKNISADFGVYDLRTPNEVSKTAAFQAKVGNFKEMTYFGTCWLDLLPDADKKVAKALPGSGTEGKVSDYCK